MKRRNNHPSFDELRTKELCFVAGLSGKDLEGSKARGCPPAAHSVHVKKHTPFYCT
jgi:hypothetical protein